MFLVAVNGFVFKKLITFDRNVIKNKTIGLDYTQKNSCSDLIARTVLQTAMILSIMRSSSLNRRMWNAIYVISGRLID